MHGPDLDLRNQLSPLIKNYGVNVVFSGHEHSYQRLKPVDNVYYFVQGDSGKLARHDFHYSNELAASFDQRADLHDRGDYRRYSLLSDDL